MHQMLLEMGMILELYARSFDFSFSSYDIATFLDD